MLWRLLEDPKKTVIGRRFLPFVTILSLFVVIERGRILIFTFPYVFIQILFIDNLTQMSKIIIIMLSMQAPLKQEIAIALPSGKFVLFFLFLKVPWCQFTIFFEICLLLSAQLTILDCISGFLGSSLVGGQSAWSWFGWCFRLGAFANCWSATFCHECWYESLLRKRSQAWKKNGQCLKKAQSRSRQIWPHRFLGCFIALKGIVFLRTTTVRVSTPAKLFNTFSTDECYNNDWKSVVEYTFQLVQKYV